MISRSLGIPVSERSPSRLQGRSDSPALWTEIGPCAYLQYVYDTAEFQGISEEDVASAFRWLAAGSEADGGRVTLGSLREKLAPFFPHMSLAELRFLMGSAKSMSAGEVTELLGVATRRRGTRSPSAPGTAARAASPHREKPDAAKSSTLGQFDPVAEAFAVLDPTGSGFIDAGVLADIMATLLQSDLTPQDAAVLVKAADKDGDGRVSLADFRSMLASSDSRKKSEFGDVAADDKPADDDD